MRTTTPLFVSAAAFVAAACSPQIRSVNNNAAAVIQSAAQPGSKFIPSLPGETHLGRLQQLTNGGENAEAYFSADGQYITFQSTRDGRTCDQQFVMKSDGTGITRVSNGQGKTTCGWFLPGSQRLFFASTHAADAKCPVKLDPSKGYVWGIDPYDIYTVGRDGKDMKRLTNYNTYTAEGVLSPDGKRIVFTSLKGGDLDIYTMNVDGTDVKQLTTALGYDGGPWWSPDGKQIVYRAYHPTDTAELRAYQDLLKERMIRPNKMEIFTMNADGSNQKQITHLGGANFGPSWAPGGKQIIFSSNHTNPKSGNFDLYLINLDGSELTQLTNSPVFDGFPMFSPDGKKLIFASNRNDAKEGETNLFMAEWKK